MLKPRIEKALNDQVNAEMYSAYLYLSMDAYFLSTNLKGFANWMRCQAQEEMVHAMKLYNYIYERLGRVKLAAIDEPKKDWKSPREAFEDTLGHEQKVTGMINDLIDLAAAEKDHATVSFLRWFVDEQVEEEAQSDELVQKIRMVGSSTGALLMLDHEFGKRTFSPED